MTMDPPFGFELEVLSGSQKGSTNTHTYVPMGDKTKGILVGDFHIQGMDAEATKKATLDYFAKVFEEDNHAMRALWPYRHLAGLGERCGSPLVLVSPARVVTRRSFGDC